MSIFSTVILIFVIGQIYWAWRGYRLTAARIVSSGRRVAVCLTAAAIYASFYAFTFGMYREPGTPVNLTPQAALTAPFLWWVSSSTVAFMLVIVVAIPQSAAAAVRWLRDRARPGDLKSPPRREFLGRTALAAAGAPFVAGAYGLLYGRLNLETTTPKIILPKLPKAFEGFRICQLSDLHIGPYMSEDAIRKYAAIANEQKADMVVLTGDFVTFDPTTQQAVVSALSGLRAPFGVWGCLGNHDMWTGVEDSITDLFRKANVKMLRGENVAIPSGGESINLIGVDFQSPRRFGPSAPVRNLLGNIAGRIDRDRVNVLLSHNPDTYDRAAELGIDLSLAGHTHGGQVALEFINPRIAPSRLVTPYVAGHFQKTGGQLYVNRGIGTIFVPIRLGAPPELTVYTLSRG